MTIAASVTGYSLINACADSTQWTGSTPLNCIDFFKEGSQCVGFVMKTAGNNDSYISGSWNLSSKHLHLWWMTTALKELGSDAAGGMQISLYDGTNIGYWKMTGSTTYPGGWMNIVLDCTTSPDTTAPGTTPPVVSAITRIGFRIFLTGASKNVQNNWIDHIYIGDGITIYGDDGGNDMDFADVLAQDVSTTNGWGMIRKFGGIYYSIGSLTFGDNSGTNGLKFADSLQTIVFENRRVSSSLYGVTVVGNSTGTESFVLGSLSGSSGISGCTFRTESSTQTPKFTVTCSDTDVNTFKLYGCTFLDASTVTLPTSASSGYEVVSSTFEKCGDVNVLGCKVEYCNFVSADDNGIVVNTTSWLVKYCKFVACPDGIKITTAGSYDSTDNVFASCTKDLDNNTAGVVTFNNLGSAANASTSENTGGGSTSIVTTKAVNVHVQNESGTSIQNAVVYIQRATPTSYTSDSGNDAGDSTFVVNETVDTDQKQTGWIRVWNKAANAVVSFRYASWSSKTFTLMTEVTGSATSTGDSTALTDTAASFGSSEDVVIGDAIRNTTDGSWALVDEVISTTHIHTTELRGGSDNTWTSGDNYSIHRLPISFTDNNDLVDIPLYMALTNSSGNIAEYAHNYVNGAMNITVRVRYNEGATKYVPYSTSGQIGASGYTLTAVMQQDTVAT